MLDTIKKIMINDLQDLDRLYSELNKIENPSSFDFNPQKKNLIQKIRENSKNKKEKQKLEQELELFIANHPLFANYEYRKKTLGYGSNIYEVINSASTLKDLNMTFKEAETLLKKHNLQVVLDESDLKVCENEAKFESLENFVLVHKQDMLPSDNMLRTREDNLLETSNIDIANIGEISYPLYRHTLHFSVNGEVGNHAYGDWSKCKCAIIVPFEDVQANQIKSAASVDTYVEGNLNLTENSILLCPEEMVEEAKLKNPNIRVYGYKGNSVQGYGNAVVGLLGYKVQEMGMWNWTNQHDQNQYSNMIKEITPFDQGFHAYTDDAAFEKIIEQKNKFLACIEKIQKNNLSLSNEEMRLLLQNVLQLGNHNFKEKESLEKFKNLLNEFVVDLQKYNLDISDILSYIEQNIMTQESNNIEYSNLINASLYNQMFIYFVNKKLDKSIQASLNDQGMIEINTFLQRAETIKCDTDSELEMLTQATINKLLNHNISMNTIIKEVQKANIDTKYKIKSIDILSNMTVTKFINDLDRCLENGLQQEMINNLLNNYEFEILNARPETINYLSEALNSRGIDITENVNNYLLYSGIKNPDSDTIVENFQAERSAFLLGQGFATSDFRPVENYSQVFDNFFKKSISESLQQYALTEITENIEREI